MNPSIAVTDLSKNYGRCVAVNKLSFTVEPGVIYGLIGPNGAGKTTTLSILAGLVSATSGSAAILGMRVEPNRRELVAKVGFASSRYSFFDYLTGAEILLTCGLMHGLKAHEVKCRTDELLAVMDLEEAAGHYLYEWSQGMRQKLGLACALIHAPEVLLLDEPFTGLDPTSVYRISRMLRQMSDRARTIVLTSHDLALVERLVDRVGILHQGVLRREIKQHHARDQATPMEVHSRLESVLWEVVGTPEFKELSWI
jgi:ABC-2 type transport system ATP-binding protein